MRIGNKSTRNEQNGQNLSKHGFFKKRIKFEMIGHITLQMKSLREFFIPQ